MVTEFLIPDLSLPKQFEQERDRRKAAELSRDELSIIADKLIVDWYRQGEVIERLMRHVQRLEVDLMLATAEPSPPQPSGEHFQWARDLLSVFRP